MSSTLSDTGIIAVLRARTVGQCLPAIETLLEAGISDIELTMTIPDLLDDLPDVVTAYPDASIGVGTVTTASQAREAVAAGATFLVTPALIPDVMAAIDDLAVPVYPGAMTPTEILAASRGATAVKLFPAATLGPAYIAHIHGPFPEVALLPSGGITIDAIPTWIRAGAIAVSLGSPLLGDTLDGGNLRPLAARARAALDAVSTGREP